MSSPIRVKGLRWLGTRTKRDAETVAFFRDVLGLPVVHRMTGLVVLGLPDGGTVEVFGPATAMNEHMTHPVAGLLVEDLRVAEEQLRAVGVPIVLARREGADRAWLHFEAPDGFVYELTEVW